MGLIDKRGGDRYEYEKKNDRSGVITGSELFSLLSDTVLSSFAPCPG